MPTDARGLEVPEAPPDGPLSGAFWRLERQCVAAETHCTFEGHDIPRRAVLEGYDRALHPWMHGRRPHDLYERYGDVLESVGFVIGAAIAVLIYGPGHALRTVWGWLNG